jgi:hypothetical protein
MLTDAQRVDVRRFCGYPLYGGQPVQAFGYRFFQQYGTLEFRMTNMQDAEEAVVVNYLTQLTALETAIYGTSDNLDTDVAAVWTHNKNEQRDREALFDSTRRRLCAFFGIPPGPAFDVSGSGGSIALVV